jgi:hypothetical protein
MSFSPQNLDKLTYPELLTLQAEVRRRLLRKRLARRLAANWRPLMARVVMEVHEQRRAGAATVVVPVVEKGTVSTEAVALYYGKLLKAFENALKVKIDVGVFSQVVTCGGGPRWRVSACLFIELQPTAMPMAAMLEDQTAAAPREHIIH